MRFTTTPGLITTLALLAGCSSDGDSTDPVPAGDASYKVTFTSSWSAATHPMDFPGNPHFSPLIGATHNASVSFWMPGGLATDGIERMAEVGDPSLLSDEAQAAIASGAAAAVILGEGIAVSPGVAVATFDITEAYPLVTLVSMVAPSPDWFVGVRALSLLDAGQWVDGLTVDLYAYDAGTDSGTSYGSENADTDPAETISELDTEPFLVGGTVPSLGTFTFERQ